MGALDDLLANNKPSSSKPAPRALAPKVAAAQGGLESTTKKIAAQARAKGTSGGKLDEILSTAKRLQEGKKDNGWHWSFNPIEDVAQIAQHVPGVSTALNVLDTPAAYVRSLVNQTANALDFNDNQGFDLGQLVSDAQQHKGIGQYFQEQLQREAARNPNGKADVFGIQIDPNSDSGAATWFKRAVGLTGDIASDPLTYVSGGLSGAGGEVAKGISRLDRVELAKELAAKGASDSAIEAVARKGVAALPKAEQLALGVRPTLAIGGQAIPGTAPVANALRKVTGETRALLGDTALGKAARSIGVNEAERPFVEEAIKGGGRAAPAIKALDAIDFAKASGRQFANQQGQKLVDILKGVSKQDMKTLAHDVEQGVNKPHVQAVQDWLAETRQRANALGADIKDLGPTYFPHSLTQDARDAMEQQGALARSGVGASPEMARGLRPGEQFLGQPLQDASLREINTISKGQLGHDLFKTEAGDVLGDYNSAVSHAVQRATNASRLVQHGVAREIPKSDPIIQGFSEISKSTGSRTIARDWVADAVAAKRAVGPQHFKTLTAGWDRFTQLWKSGATFSPGFHVRNAYSGFFNNFVAGVKSGAYEEYDRLGRQAIKGTLKAADQDAWDYVQKVVHASGNAFDPAEIGRGFKPAAHKVLGLPGRASRRAGNFVEDHLRGAMALDSFKRGDSLTAAISRVERFHFNYADVSQFDRYAKRVIPFWMFTSRNIPLQLQMMLRSPNAYTKFLALQRNLSLGVQDPSSIVPSYFGEQGAIPTDLPFPGGEGQKYLALDMPFLRVNKDLEMLTNPERLLSEANPLIKLPFEQIAGKKLYNDVPFTDTPQPLPHGDLLSKVGIAQFLEGLGLAQQGADGPMITDRALNTIESLVPVAGRARRLVPDEELYNQRLGTSVASFLGLSSLTNSPAAQKGELLRRQRALDAFMKEMQGLGYLAKPKSGATKKKPFGKG